MLTPNQIQSLSNLFPPGQVFHDPASLITYETDAGEISGAPEVLVVVNNTTDIQRLLEWAKSQALLFTAKVPVTARGAGTGLTGGAVAEEGGVLLSLARMNKIIEIDVQSHIAFVQPGVITQALQRQVASFGLAYPPDPASHTVCTIGGNIAENAGGPHCLKYGVTGNYVLGLQVVLADGTLIELGGQALDPPEYDFTSLVTGSEGTLAIVTQAILRLRRLPPAVKALTATFDSVTVAGQAVSAVIAAGLQPGTIEFMDHKMINIVEDYLNAGFPRQAQAMLIMDIDGSPDSLDMQLDQITAILQDFHPIDIKVARTPEQRETLWRGRRSAAGAMSRISPNELAIDVSVPRSRLAETFTAINHVAEQHNFPVGYLAHVGDGNLHPNLLCDFSIPGERERVHKAAEEVLAYCASIGGSIGGEHGIGIEKREFMPLMYSPEEITAMLEIKRLFDPTGMLNPGKIFPPEKPSLEFETQYSHLPNPETEPSTTAVLFTAAVTFTATAPAKPWQNEEPPLFEPLSAEQAADGLHSAQAASQKVYLSGMGSQWRGASPGSAITTRQLRGIEKLSTDDMYITVRAGTTLAEIQAALAERSFWMPITSPWAETTIGGAVATNLNGPQRSQYGSLRDQVLAIQVALADGRLLRFGRPLVKDVAGYQMNKLFCGSFGTLGMLTEITLKIYPRPQARRSLMVDTEQLSQILNWGAIADKLITISSGLVLFPTIRQKTNEGHSGESTSSSLYCRYSLLVTAEGHPLDVSAELTTIRKAWQSAGAENIDEIEQYHATQAWEACLAGSAFAIKAAVPPRLLPELLTPDLFANTSSDFYCRSDLDCHWIADLGNGILTVTGDAIDPSHVGDRISLATSAARSSLEALRARTQNGYAILSAGPRTWYTTLDAWGPARSSQSLMRRLRNLWDPAGVLNPGEFVS